MNVTLNADFDGDAVNEFGIPIIGVDELLAGFSPTNMLIDRTSERIRLDVSPLENIVLAIISDK